MTATNGSPSPKPRPGKHHRHTRSSSSLTPSGPKNHHSLNQGSQVPFNTHYIPFNNHHHNNNPAVRSAGAVLTPPQTPKAQGFIASMETSGKKKKKTRGRQKDSVPATKPVPLPFSPVGTNESVKTQSENIAEPISLGQMTPPKLSGTPMKAYAGPLFHSSPNPSALPVPKFFSKSVPVTRAGNGLQAMVESEDSEDNSTTSSVEQTGESHLQKLFRVDKEEKERLKMKRQSSGSSSSTEGSIGTPFDCSEFNGSSVFEMVRSAPRTPRPVDGIFSIDMDKPTSPLPTRLFHRTHSSPFNHTLSATQKNQTVYTPSKGDDLKRTADLLKSHLLSPLASPNHDEPSSPVPAPRSQRPNLNAGPPLTPTRNNQASPVQGFVGIPSYSLDRAPRTSVNDLFGSVVRQAGPPQSPLALRASPFCRDAPLNSSSPQRNSQPKKSALASKLETARGSDTPSKSVAEMENDLRRALNLDSYVSNAALGGGVLI
ncbi:unnamed protein product [Tuber melanosporum]|uniref:(Perigord truffle) hypothetical protein n=1 Tax=Tuber melanosporum (strain Mel28) TaxID=656061 RepID=D5GDB2_TUBMM|nr:uncharacterized protein GSTUM_00006133001 [Tuber melanosporum]CAZ82505.1 unnamed protein product [Tuber melanosporum]